MTPGTGRARSLRAAHRLSAWAVALIWCATPLLAALHAGVEVHRYCAEHRAVEEVESGEHGEAEASPIAAGESASSEHDDCSFARFCRFGQVLAQIVLEATQPLAQRPAHLPEQASPAPAIAVLLIAPKTSPPV